MARVWCGVVCNGEKAQAAVRTWFPMVPDDWGLPLKADMQEDENTGRTTALRALFRLPDGRLKEAGCRFSQRARTYQTGDASPAILKDWHHD